MAVQLAPLMEEIQTRSPGGRWTMYGPYDNELRDAAEVDSLNPRQLISLRKYDGKVFSIATPDNPPAFFKLLAEEYTRKMWTPEEVSPASVVEVPSVDVVLWRPEMGQAKVSYTEAQVVKQLASTRYGLGFTPTFLFQATITESSRIKFTFEDLVKAEARFTDIIGRNAARMLGDQQ